jgi:hypothetical protein
MKIREIVLNVVKQISEEYGIPEEEILSITFKKFKEDKDIKA